MLDNLSPRCHPSHYKHITLLAQNISTHTLNHQSICSKHRLNVNIFTIWWMGSIFQQNIPCWYNGHHWGWGCTGWRWKPELSLLQPSKFLISNASHQNYPALPWKLPQISKHQPGNGLKCDRGPLNNNQISWYKTQLHFSSSQRSWLACYILLTPGYLWFMDGVINKPFLKFNSNSKIRPLQPASQLNVHWPFFSPPDN